MRVNYRDMITAAIFVAMGLAFSGYSWFGLTIGRATRMGEGFFPFVLGLILCGFGLLVAVAALRTQPEKDDPISWRGLGLVTAGIVFFGLTIRGLGLVPALVGTILTAAFASPRTTVFGAAMLASGLTAFCVVIFVYLLGLPLALIGPWLKV